MTISWMPFQMFWFLQTGVVTSVQSSGPASFVLCSRLSTTETDNRLSTLDTLVIKPATNVAKIISDFFTSRPISSLIYNFMRGMSLHWDYNKRSGFVAERGQNNFADQNIFSCCITDFESHLIHSIFIYLIRCNVLLYVYEMCDSEYMREHVCLSVCRI